LNHQSDCADGRAGEGGANAEHPSPALPTRLNLAQKTALNHDDRNGEALGSVNQSTIGARHHLDLKGGKQGAARTNRTEKKNARHNLRVLGTGGEVRRNGGGDAARVSFRTVAAIP